VTVKSFLLAFILCLASLLSRGQQVTQHEWFYWIRYYNQAKLNQKLTLHSEIDTRRFLNSSRQSQFFTHFHLHRQFKPWLDAAAGFNFNLTQFIHNDLYIPEIRPWQEINLFTNSSKKWQLSFRYRLDERFIHNNNSVELTDGYHFNLRHRFRIMTSTTLVNFRDKNILILKIYDEVMLNTGDVPRSFDQNRLSGSLEYRFNKHWSLESGYINILQPVTNSEYFERHVIRTTIYHRIG
jgi:hypothetical protein